MSEGEKRRGAFSKENQQGSSGDAQLMGIAPLYAAGRGGEKLRISRERDNLLNTCPGVLKKRRQSADSGKGLLREIGRGEGASKTKRGVKE